MFIRGSLHMFIHGSLHMFIHGSLHMFIHESLQMFIHGSLHMFIHESLHMFIHESLHGPLDEFYLTLRLEEIIHQLIITGLGICYHMCLAGHNDIGQLHDIKFSRIVV